MMLTKAYVFFLLIVIYEGTFTWSCGCTQFYKSKYFLAYAFSIFSVHIHVADAHLIKPKTFSPGWICGKLFYVQIDFKAEILELWCKIQAGPYANFFKTRPDMSSNCDYYHNIHCLFQTVVTTFFLLIVR